MGGIREGVQHREMIGAGQGFKTAPPMVREIAALADEFIALCPPHHNMQAFIGRRGE